jgi:hypothetical protein
MERIILTKEMLAHLQNATQPVELCDEAGRVVAHLMPVFDPARWGPLQPQVSLEEIQRRANSNEKRYTTAEVLEHLRGL